jgi:hypothetical protein
MQSVGRVSIRRFGSHTILPLVAAIIAVLAEQRHSSIRCRRMGRSQPAGRSSSHCEQNRRITLFKDAFRGTRWLVLGRQLGPGRHWKKQHRAEARGSRGWTDLKGTSYSHLGRRWFPTAIAVALNGNKGGPQSGECRLAHRQATTRATASHCDSTRSRLPTQRPVLASSHVVSMHELIADTDLHQPHAPRGAPWARVDQGPVGRRQSVTEAFAAHERPRAAVRSGTPEVRIPETRFALSAWLKTEVGVFHVKHSNFQRLTSLQIPAIARS